MLDYYRTAGVRETCHALKGDFGQLAQNEAICKVAKYFLSQYRLNANDVIVPAPQHTGSAEYTMRIAEIIKSNTPVVIADVLGRMPEEMLYAQKKIGESKCVNMFLKNTLPIVANYYFLDNVIDTGLTYLTAKRICGTNLKPMIYAENM
jgi:hypothetical protein